jgi:hypothetical protein
VSLLLDALRQAEKNKVQTGEPPPPPLPSLNEEAWPEAEPYGSEPALALTLSENSEAAREAMPLS